MILKVTKVFLTSQQMQLLNSSCDKPVVVRRHAPMAQTVLGSPAVTVHRQDRRNPCPDAAADPSSSDRAANDPLVTQTQVPTIQKAPKIVELPQAQFMETNP